jgi:hypothetical protein
VRNSDRYPKREAYPARRQKRRQRPELGSPPVAEPLSARPLSVDLQALRAILSGFERRGITLEREVVETLAVVVLAWPTVVDTAASARETARKMFASGIPMLQISAEVGLHRHTVAAWTADLPRRRGGRGHRVPDEALEEAFALIEEGKTHREAAEAAGISQSVVSRALQGRSGAQMLPDHALAS